MEAGKEPQQQQIYQIIIDEDEGQGQGQEPTFIQVEEPQQQQQPREDVDLNQKLLLQSSAENYALELLENVRSEFGAFLDLAVFCRDGLVWSSRLLLSAVSPLIRNALSNNEESSIVLPQISKLDFSVFQKALFDVNVEFTDIAGVVKVAEILNVETGFAIEKDDVEEDEAEFKRVDYRSARLNYEDGIKLNRIR